MTPKTAAAVGLRLIGVWLVIEASFGLVNLCLASRYPLAGMPGVHRRYYTPPGATPPTIDFYLHDTYYVLAGFALPAAVVALRFSGGLVLLLASKPLGALVARKLDDA